MRTPFLLRSLGLCCICLFVIMSAGCDKDDNDMPDITIADLVGTWKATSSIHTDNSNPAQSFDIVANGGEVRFTLLDDGRVRTWVEIGAFYDEWDALATISGNKVTTVPAESERGVRVSTIEFDGTTLTLTNLNDEWNFTNGVEPNVSTTSVSVFLRD